VVLAGACASSGFPGNKMDTHVLGGKGLERSLADRIMWKVGRAAKVLGTLETCRGFLGEGEKKTYKGGSDAIRVIVPEG